MNDILNFIICGWIVELYIRFLDWTCSGAVMILTCYFSISRYILSCEDSFWFYEKLSWVEGDVELTRFGWITSRSFLVCFSRVDRFIGWWIVALESSRCDGHMRYLMSEFESKLWYRNIVSAILCWFFVVALFFDITEYLLCCVFSLYFSVWKLLYKNFNCSIRVIVGHGSMTNWLLC